MLDVTSCTRTAAEYVGESTGPDTRQLSKPNEMKRAQ
jgi:hypothetical protein